MDCDKSTCDTFAITSSTASTANCDANEAAKDSSCSDLLGKRLRTHCANLVHASAGKGVGASQSQGSGKWLEANKGLKLCKRA